MGFFSLLFLGGYYIEIRTMSIVTVADSEVQSSNIQRLAASGGFRGSEV
jgi:hypothetical protein